MNTMSEYHKIEGIFTRCPETRKLIPEFRNPVVGMLANIPWIFTEKVDGTNIRVIWDGHSVSFAGRTDKATIPAPLLSVLNDTFGGDVGEQIFEEHFGDKHVVLYGEGYGAKIQKGGGLYRKDNGFILFDVKVNDKYLERINAFEVAKYFGIDHVPILFIGTIGEAIEYVKKRPCSVVAEEPKEMEGVVGTPAYELKTGNGERLIVKIKVRDMEEAYGHQID